MELSAKRLCRRSAAGRPAWGRCTGALRWIIGFHQNAFCTTLCRYPPKGRRARQGANWTGMHPGGARSLCPFSPKPLVPAVRLARHPGQNRVDFVTGSGRVANRASCSSEIVEILSPESLPARCFVLGTACASFRLTGEGTCARVDLRSLHLAVCRPFSSVCKRFGACRRRQ